MSVWLTVNHHFSLSALLKPHFNRLCPYLLRISIEQVRKISNGQNWIKVPLECLNVFFPGLHSRGHTCEVIATKLTQNAARFVRYLSPIKWHMTHINTSKSAYY